MTQGVPTELLFDIPRAWRTDLAGYSWTMQTSGRSSAEVFRLEASGRPTLFLKTEPTGTFAELPDEAARLQWLATNGIACPNVVAETCEAQRNWLLMNAVPGRDLAASPLLAPGRIVEIAADALRDLHRLDVVACRFDHRLDRRINDARARMEAGLVNEADFDEKRQGRTAPSLFKELLVRRPGDEDFVVAHGDAYLPICFRTMANLRVSSIAPGSASPIGTRISRWQAGAFATSSASAGSSPSFGNTGSRLIQSGWSSTFCSTSSSEVWLDCEQP